MSDMERKEELLLVTDNMLAAWKRWMEAPDLKFITRALEEAIDDAILLWSEGSLPAELRAMASDVEQLGRHWDEWKTRAGGNPQRYPVPEPPFWQVLERIMATRTELARPPRRRLEPVAKLRAMPGMRDLQICDMYGFFDATGQPEFHKLDDEERDPGCHSYKIEGWMPPLERRAAEERAKRDAILARAKEVRSAKVARMQAPPAKETIEELLALPGMSGKQVCDLKHIEREQLEVYCRENGLAMPAWEPTAANALSSVYDVIPEGEKPATAFANPKEPEETPAPAAGEPLTIEQQVVLYSQANMPPAEIAEALNTPDNPLDAKAVVAIVKRWKRDPSSIVLPENAIA